jgi:hypothetical protein
MDGATVPHVVTVVCRRAHAFVSESRATAEHRPVAAAGRHTSVTGPDPALAPVFRSRGPVRHGRRGTMRDAMAERDETPLGEQLEEIGAQLDWVRGYL